MLKIIAIALTASSILAIAAGHSCSDGSRVKCLAVRSSNRAPSTYGQGYSAGGYPTCSAEGKRVFCLFDHDYHTCADGSEPCCMDGSNPSHRGTHSGDDHNLDCGASIEPIVLDNMDSTIVGEMKNAVEGRYQPCMADAYKGQFHHDCGINKGSAHFTYKFMPPADGCYSIEEYHPGSDKACSRYLPTKANLDIEYCKGKTFSLEINQAQNGAQWNEIVSGLPFYAGTEGRLIMRNHVAEVCEEIGNCFWVADAFRLTYKGPTCQSGEEATKPCQNATVSQTDAYLYLQLSLGAGLEKDGVLLKMQEHKPRFEKTFAVHLGYKSVSIMAITTSGRRLHGDESSQVSLQVRFKGNAQNRQASTPETFKAALQADFTTIVPGVTVEKVSQDELRSRDPEKDTDNSSNRVLYLSIAGASLVFLGIASFCVWRTFRSKKNPQISKVDQVIVKPCDETSNDEAAKEIAKSNLEDLEKAMKVDHCDTASTGTPSSEPPASLVGTNADANSKRDEETPTLCSVPNMVTT